MDIIETCHLSRKFKQLTAVQDLNLSVDKGEILSFLGPNGAGKTTTVRMLAGIIAPTSGYAVVSGIRIDQNVEQLHKVIGLLTETPGFYNRLSANFNLEYYANFYENINVKIQVEKYLKLFGLWERRKEPVGTYSKGMKQRLALARALLHEPEVLFLDEPTSGLDPEASHDVRNIIVKLSQEGRTIFMCTHNLSEAEELSHRIAFFRTGLLAIDTTENLRNKLFRKQVVITLETINDNLLNNISNLAYVQKAIRTDNNLVVTLKNHENYRTTLLKAIIEFGGNILSVSDEKHTLEEIYLKLLHGENNAA
jgi:ABC-2 type transport system ATP-binding protein